MKFGVGVVEGFYGAPWSAEARLATLRFLADAGYASYLYAPKADRALRDEWRRTPDRQWLAGLGDMIAEARSERLYFGVGLSPIGAEQDFAAARAVLVRRARLLADRGVDMLALLFDDMPAPDADAALQQVDLMRAVADASGIPRLLFCPTWYSDDPRLDAISGPRPARYLETIGERLDSDIGVFWTGPQICTRAWTGEHLADITARLGRAPVLWDNYPVNDGPRLCRELHLRAFEGRGVEVSEQCDGVFANPMSQCALSWPPLLTLPWNLWQPGYDADAATPVAFHRTLPIALAQRLERDWRRFASPGLDGMSEDERTELASDYVHIDHPAATEIVEWLRGHTLVEAVTSQP